MPELPEVETTRKGIYPYVVGKPITTVHVLQKRLRWPVPSRLAQHLAGTSAYELERRSKYLLFRFNHGTLIVHLGMSGSLRIVDKHTPFDHHEHIALDFAQLSLRFRDPRKFGAFLWTRMHPYQHKLLKNLGPEPLSDVFSAAYLYQTAHRRKASIKDFIMNSKVVAGVGNIYATEALFEAGIHPRRAAGNISLHRCELLVIAIQRVLTQALQKGGTTLRDFTREDGKPGYFRQELKAYGRAGLACPRCSNPLKTIRLGQRSSVYCGHCQR